MAVGTSENSKFWSGCAAVYGTDCMGACAQGRKHFLLNHKYGLK